MFVFDIRHVLQPARLLSSGRLSGDQVAGQKPLLLTLPSHPVLSGTFSEGDTTQTPRVSSALEIPLPEPLWTLCVGVQLKAGVGVSLLRIATEVLAQGHVRARLPRKAFSGRVRGPTGVLHDR